VTIVDCHCHAGRGDDLTDPWTTDAPLGAYLRRASRAGIQRTVVVPTFPRDSRRGNRELAGIVARSRGRLMGFAWVHPRRDAGRIDSLVEEAVRLGLRGLKVHAHHAMPTRELCEAARRHRLPVLVDVFNKGHAVEMFAGAYPDVTFVVPHLGSFVDDWRAHQTVIDCMVRLPNVYADTSGVRRFDYLLEAVRRAGAHKLLFGSDGPWLHPGLELHKIRLMGLRPDQERLVTGGNLLRLLAPSRRVRAITRGGERPRSSRSSNRSRSGTSASR
jgi:predicted TIM-barrel fold metal-dependent hydrolase